MSKRANAQALRRQIRRALNNNPEFFKQVGHGFTRHAGYSSGISSHEIKEPVREEDIES